MQDIKPVKISLDKFKKAEEPAAAPTIAKPADKPKISDVYVAWEAEEYEFNEKSPDWYWMVGIIAIAFIAVAIFMKNMLFTIIIMLSAFSFALLGARRPERVKFKIALRGVHVGNKLYLYDDLDSFWIHYDPPHRAELIIVSKRAVAPHISIPLAEIDPNEAREHLLKFLPEKLHEESLAEILGRLVGF
ncbi:MAG: hypothetical protein HZA25_01225 [Candidatus Niyogibacteria bacterium]|nr:hypothetical protein [Candidatus Niyogibacteria bacterium]